MTPREKVNPLNNTLFLNIIRNLTEFGERGRIRPYLTNITMAITVVPDALSELESRAEGLIYAALSEFEKVGDPEVTELRRAYQKGVYDLTGSWPYLDENGDLVMEALTYPPALKAELEERILGMVENEQTVCSEESEQMPYQSMSFDIQYADLDNHGYINLEEIRKSVIGANPLAQKIKAVLAARGVGNIQRLELRHQHDPNSVTFSLRIFVN